MDKNTFFYEHKKITKSAEHDDSFVDGVRNSVESEDSRRVVTKKADDVDRIDDLDDLCDSDSSNGEFITIKVTNSEGKTECQEVDHIKDHVKPK